MNNILWDKYYQETLKEEIPWNRTQADWLVELLEAKKLGSGKALDLGCGVGMKSILSVRNGFEVTGIDISGQAIEYAKENARQESVNIKFVAGDVTDLSFLGDEKYDLVLDWAVLHSVGSENVNQYVREVIDRIKKGGKLVLRCFGREDADEQVASTPMGDISLFSENDIERLYGDNFDIVETSRSKPSSGSPPSEWFGEYLMVKK